MHTNKEKLAKGLKILGITLFLMFAGPTVLWQALRNQGHPFFWPVLILGALLALGAMAFGFYGIKTVVDAVFGPKKPSKRTSSK